jgi:hypothetical protein
VKIFRKAGNELELLYRQSWPRHVADQTKAQAEEKVESDQQDQN